MIVLIDSQTGVQALPAVDDRRSQLTPWWAVQCLSADQRTKQPVYAAIAGRLVLAEAPNGTKAQPW